MEARSEDVVTVISATAAVVERPQAGGAAKKAAPQLPSLEEIRSAIPAECFVKDWRRSMTYFVFDLIVLGLLYYIVPTVESRYGWLGLLAWYYVMGMFASSLFCIGHDCGHSTFSDYEWLNDLVGHIAHGAIMVPYWPWQKSHRQHHQYTAHLEKDKGHPWVTEEEFVTRNVFMRNFARFPLTVFIRWNPVYTILGLPDGSHFWPYSRLFNSTSDRIKCVVSGSVCVATSYIAFVLSGYSLTTWLKYYYVPIMFQGLWIIMITYLQHQEEEIEVYENSEWNFVRGQSQTIDRTYGFGMDYLLHHITDGHVAHHFFFTKIPHYHLPKATTALQKVLANYPGVYKYQSCYNALWEFFALNLKLDYLLGKGTGVLKYRTSKDYKDAKHK